MCKNVLIPDLMLVSKVEAAYKRIILDKGKTLTSMDISLIDKKFVEVKGAQEDVFPGFSLFGLNDPYGPYARLDFSRVEPSLAINICSTIVQMYNLLVIYIEKPDAILLAIDIGVKHVFNMYVKGEIEQVDGIWCWS